MTTKYKLAIIPEGYKVVPEGFISKVESSHRTTNIVAKEILVDEAIEILKAAPQLDTPPVLRWSGWRLEFNGNKIASLHCWGDGKWTYELWRKESYNYDTEHEARRAAEKALGLPEFPEV